MTEITQSARNRLEINHSGDIRILKIGVKKLKVKNASGVYYRESSSKRFRGKPDKCFYVTYRNALKKFVWEKVGWSSEGYNSAFASNLRAERIRAIRHGEELPKDKSQPVTFGEVWKEYSKWQDANISRPYDNNLRYKNHLKERFENKPLDKIKAIDLENLKSELLKSGRSPATIKHVLVLVRQIFNKARAWGMYEGENPVSSVKLPKLNNRRERFLTKDEAVILLKAIEQTSPQLKNMALLSLYTGLRAGEIFNLRWSHIDLKLGLITVSDSKSGHSRKAFMTESVKVMFKSFEKGKPNEFVFQDRYGEQIREISKTFSRVMKKLKWNEGITDRRQKVTFHSLRHTFASWLAIQGTHILHIKELMGHQSLAMTERYSHLIPDVKREAVEKLEG